MVPIGYIDFDIALTNGIEGASICSSDITRKDRLERDKVMLKRKNMVRGSRVINFDF
jgi:hypothetical protein